MEGGVDVWRHMDYPLDLVKKLAGLDFVGVHVPVRPYDEGYVELGQELDEFLEPGHIGAY